MQKIAFRESYGQTKRKRIYVNNETHSSETPSLDLIEESERFTSASSFFSDVFLPKGFPASVSDDYVQYQIWDTVQAFASSITNTLATQAVLKGVGVGDEQATVLAATLTWLMKDGTGMLGRILFTWIQGSYLDCDCKRWRLFADILNDVSILMDICAPFFRVYFTLIVCVAGVCRSIVGVAGGATRAAVTQHQACRSNMADVSAKDGSQETLVNLAALLCNLALVPMVSDRQWLVWILFTCFTTLHIYANFKAVRSLDMPTFNQVRLHLAAQEFISDNTGNFPGVKTVNQREPVLCSVKRKFSINLGASLSRVYQDQSRVANLQKMFFRERFMLNLNLRAGVIDIFLQEDAETCDMLKALLHAEIIERAKHNSSPAQLQNLVSAVSSMNELSAISISQSLNEELFSQFLSRAKSVGWNIKDAMLNADEWRTRIDKMF